MSNSGHVEELQAERDHIEFLYRHLDAERTAAARRLEDALKDSGSKHMETRVLREVTVGTLSSQINRFRGAESGLCFGRIDAEADGATYIGRIGLYDEEADYEPLLLDWRAPASRPFYAATGASPEGLSRRRHFRTKGRTIVDFHDDVFELHGALDGDAALLAALDAPREETMRDIVATIQAEQDRIIRLAHNGVVVIDGGPGTGKTAVALHRVAYLLYHQRERLSRSGVLIIGPNPAFLRWIGDVLRAAIADRQELPEEPIEIALSDVTVVLGFDEVALAREEARASGLRHNQARAVFVQAVVEALTRRAVDAVDPDQYDALDPAVQAALDADPMAGDGIDLHDMLGPDFQEALARHPGVLAAVESLWPVLTPQRLLRELYASPSRCAMVHASRLYRPAGDAWTVSDVALLDEAAELLGPAGEQAAADDGALEYARGVLEVLDTDEDAEEEGLMRAVDLVSAEQLAERHEVRDNRSIAERAAEDREWTYGHVVVDEAQELSEMDWRVVMRRCPTRSMTVVGDLAQRGSPAGARTWGAMLGMFVDDRWAHQRLAINYRTPAEVMEFAHRILPGIEPPVSVRRTGVPPVLRRVDDLSKAVRAELDGVLEGTVAVIAPPEVRLDVPVPVLTPSGAKGLEFDVVIVVEPGLIKNPADLYVALTRATQRLAVLHTTDLPNGLRVE